jgi:hypothetical protein
MSREEKTSGEVFNDIKQTEFFLSIHKIQQSGEAVTREKVIDFLKELGTTISDKNLSGKYYLAIKSDFIATKKNRPGNKKGSKKRFVFKYPLILKNYLELMFSETHSKLYGNDSRKKYSNGLESFYDEIVLLSEYFKIFLDKIIAAISDKNFKLLPLNNLIEIFIKNIDNIRNYNCLPNDEGMVYYLFLNKMKYKEISYKKEIIKKLKIRKDDYKLFNNIVEFKFDKFIERINFNLDINLEYGIESANITPYLRNDKEYEPELEVNLPPEHYYLGKELFYSKSKDKNKEKIIVGNFLETTYYETNDFFQQLIKKIIKYELF